MCARGGGRGVCWDGGGRDCKGRNTQFTQSLEEFRLSTLISGPEILKRLYLLIEIFVLRFVFNGISSEKRATSILGKEGRTPYSDLFHWASRADPRPLFSSLSSTRIKTVTLTVTPSHRTPIPSPLSHSDARSRISKKSRVAKT